MDLAGTTKQLDKLALKDLKELKNEDIRDVEVAFLKNEGILAIEFLNNPISDSSEARIANHAQANAAHRLQANLTYVLAANSMANQSVLKGYMLPLMSVIANFLPQPQISYYARLADAIHSYEELHFPKVPNWFLRCSRQKAKMIMHLFRKLLRIKMSGQKTLS